MDRTLTNLIKALRAANVPVSIGESIDALKTTAMVGYDDRTFLKNSLATVVAKSAEEKETFDALFDVYFSRSDLRSPNGAGEGGEQGGQPGEPINADDLLSMVHAGDNVAMAMAMEQAAARAGVENIRFATQTGYLSRRMLDELGLRDLERQILALRREHTEEADARAEALSDARAQLLGQAREYVQQQFKSFGEQATERFHEEYLERARLTDLDTRDMVRMRKLVRRMAKRLVIKHKRRTKVKNRGKLDIRKTIRANTAYDNVPFETIWRKTKKDKPKIIAVCDVSGSVAQYVRFLLMLLYSLAEVIPDLKSYAFSHKLVDVSDNFDDLEIEPAIAKVLKDVGFGSTDYGKSLEDLRSEHWKNIDRRTTVIILGDGRSNYGNPRIDIMKELSSQAKRVIWLCPEIKSMWGTGDSEMLRFAPFCDVLRRCSTVKDLEAAVDEILVAYS
jgi:hypothetical protein